MESDSDCRSRHPVREIQVSSREPSRDQNDLQQLRLQEDSPDEQSGQQPGQQQPLRQQHEQLQQQLEPQQSAHLQQQQQQQQQQQRQEQHEPPQITAEQTQHPAQLQHPQDDFQQQQQQQQQQQPPAVLVVQQPIILGRGAYINRGQPFMYRGVQLGNGKKIGMNCMVTLGVMGGMLILSAVIYGIDSARGFICAAFGAVMVGSCLRLCQKAKQDFDSLPQDHPDRVTYSAPIVLSREAREIATNTTTYRIPPGTQFLSSSSPLQGAGQMAPTYQLPAGAQVISSSTTVDSRLAPPALIQAMAAASSSSRTFSTEDKPPPYEEVCKNMQS